MKAKPPAEPEQGVSLSAPAVEVETVVSSIATPKLLHWLDDLGDAIPRVLGDADEEAVHDLRVALRRIRSLLRLVRPVSGRYHVDGIREGLRRVASATGSLRDEEVLRETIAAMPCSPEHAKAMKAWQTKRAQRERMLRKAMVRMLDARSLDEPIHRLRALLQLPCEPRRDKEVQRFAKQRVSEAHAVVDAKRSVTADDVEGMHELRITYKRLRYAVEAFSRVLPSELRTWGEVATRFQKILGTLHDHDVALDVVRRATALAPEPREALLEALSARRLQVAAEYVERAGHGSLPPIARKSDRPPA